MRLENKVGLVTAAGSGMGRAGVVRFAREGAAVGVVDLDQAAVDDAVAEIEAAGGEVQYRKWRTNPTAKDGGGQPVQVPSQRRRRPDRRAGALARLESGDRPRRRARGGRQRRATRG